MEHIVQFGIGIDDEAIRKIVMEKAEKSILDDLKKQIRTDIDNQIFVIDRGWYGKDYKKVDLQDWVKDLVVKTLEDSKEQIIEFLSRDLRNPSGNIAGEIAKLSSDVSTLSPDQIRERCEAIVSGANTINDNIADYVEDVLLKRSRQIADIGLSQREIQIIRLSAEGLTAAQIAERVFLSVNTVNTHRQRIYRKMDVKNVSEMLRKATEIGIL